MKERIIAFIQTNHILWALTISFVSSSEVLLGINENIIPISDHISNPKIIVIIANAKIFLKEKEDSFDK